MTHLDPASSLRSPSASSALLTAALGGLLCFAPGCSSGTDGSNDAGTRTDVPSGDRGGSDASVDAAPPVDVAVDAGTPADVPPSPDVAAPVDASVDAGAPTDVSADVPATDAVTPADRSDPVDAGASPDAGTAADGASVDGGASLDAGAARDGGTFDATALDATAVDATAADAQVDAAAGHDVICDVQADRQIVRLDAATGLTLDAFTVMCNGLGGFVEIHPHCGGMNSCSGFSYDTNDGTFTQHNCASLNTCTGYSCVIP